MSDESLKKLKKAAEKAILIGSKDATSEVGMETVSVSAAAVLNLIQRLIDSESRLVLAKKNVRQVEEAADSRLADFGQSSDDAEFERGYISALDLFRDKVLDHELFADKEVSSDGEE